MAYLTFEKWLRVIILLVLFFLAVILISICVGAVHIPFSTIFSWGSLTDVHREVLLGTRLPRVLLGAFVGAALSAAGVALQAIFRNPLADPHILGISGGAAIGGIGVIILSATVGWLWLGDWIQLFAFTGAIISMAIIYSIAKVKGKILPYHLLLAGVIFNAFCTAAIMFINTAVDFYQAHGILFWLMGNLSAKPYWSVILTGVYLTIGVGILMTQVHHFNAISLGDEAAIQIGVDPDRTRKITFLGVSILVGAAVSVSGIIGFIGLVVPHAMRLIVGSDHRLLLPASVITGGAFLVLADTIARTAVAPLELPVGVITTLAGGPFFIFLLRRYHREAVF
jgi:iron complex transport system permease protein